MRGVDRLESEVLVSEDVSRKRETEPFSAGACILLAKEILEVGNRVVRVPHQEALRLATVVLLAVDVGQDGGYLTV